MFLVPSSSSEESVNYEGQVDRIDTEVLIEDTSPITTEDSLDDISMHQMAVFTTLHFCPM